jgi:hypothetical protein
MNHHNGFGYRSGNFLDIALLTNTAFGAILTDTKSSGHIGVHTLFRIDRVEHIAVLIQLWIHLPEARRRHTGILCQVDSPAMFKCYPFKSVH